MVSVDVRLHHYAPPRNASQAIPLRALALNRATGSHLHASQILVRTTLRKIEHSRGKNLHYRHISQGCIALEENPATIFNQRWAMKFTPDAQGKIATSRARSVAEIRDSRLSEVQ